MEQQLDEIRSHLKNVQRIEHIIRSMRSVAATRWQQARSKLNSIRPYAEYIEELLSFSTDRLLKEREKISVEEEPYLIEGAEIIGVMVITSDKGLCGGFNTNILGHTARSISKFKEEGNEIKLLVFGHKGIKFFERSKLEIIYSRELSLSTSLSFGEVKVLTYDLERFYNEGIFDELYLFYNRSRTATSYEVAELRLLPPQFPEREPRETPLLNVEGVERKILPSFEPEIIPDLFRLSEWLLGEYLAIQLYRGLVESTASEQGARLMAMDSAANNCKDLIEALTLEYQTARQESITLELLDINTGVEALKGKK